jgi:hypothetical protein
VIQEECISVKTKVGLFLVAAILIGLAAGLAIRHWDAIVQRIAGKAMEAERRDWVQRTQELEGTVARLQQERQRSQPASRERLEQVFGASSPLVQGVSPSQLKCEELEASLRAFCDALNRSEVWRAHGVRQESWRFFVDVIAAMEQRLPATGGISLQPQVIVENSFYLYRVLGKTRLEILRDLVKDEADVAEPLMGVLYRWLMVGRGCDASQKQPQQFKAMYHYACFFLNTLGGQAYLMRRKSKVRLLTAYYATLIVHEATVQGLNESGLDVRFFLPLLANEIESRNDLSHADEYLKTLSNLQAYYGAR